MILKIKILQDLFLEWLKEIIREREAKVELLIRKMHRDSWRLTRNTRIANIAPLGPIKQTVKYTFRA